MAIALDASAVKAFTTTTSLTWSHTCTGTNPNGVLVVGVYFAVAADAPATITYGSATSNRAISLAVGASDQLSMYLFYSPPTGTNTITVTSLSELMAGVSTSFTGTNEGLDSSNTATGTGTTLTASTTVKAANCWLFGVSAIVGTGISAMTMTTGTQRQSTLSTTVIGIDDGDSNATVGTGSQSLVFSRTATTTTAWSAIVISVEPKTDTYLNPSEVYISQPVNHFFNQIVST